MTVLRLRLAGPMQAWGASSRFVTRSTLQEPTKSGVLGLLAAAQGRRRTEAIEDLAGLTFGVRTDQPGQLLRDFQVARSLDERQVMPLSYRYYLSDAVFVAAVEGPQELIQGIHEALTAPVFPLFLGRRSCVPAGRITLGMSEENLESALRAEPWQASAVYRKRQRSSRVALPIVRDAAGHGEVGETVRDVPLSFSPEHRQYGWRTVVRPKPVYVDNEYGTDAVHEPMSEMGGV